MSWREQYDEVQDGEIWYRDYDALKRTTLNALKQMYKGHFPVPDLTLKKIRKGECWGIADSQGTVLVPPQWDGIGVLPGTEEVFLVRRWDEEEYGNYAGLADRTGQVRLAPCWDMILTVEKDRVLVLHRYADDDGWLRQEALWVDWDGTMVDRPAWQFVDNGFASGVARVTLDGKVNYVDLTGRILFEIWWDDMGEFGGVKYFDRDEHASSLTWARKGDWFGFVSLTGEVVIPPIFEDAKDFGRGTDGLYGYDDTDRAAVKWQGRWGYIDETGALVIECRWGSAEPFESGLAEVTLDGKKFCLNRQGFVMAQRTGTEKTSSAFFYEGNRAKAQEVAKAFFRSSASWGIGQNLRFLFVYLNGRLPLIELLDEMEDGLPEDAAQKDAALYHTIAPLCLKYLKEKRSCSREEKAELDRFLLSAAENYMEM